MWNSRALSRLHAGNFWAHSCFRANRFIACSRRSDSGERCEVKGARKNKSTSLPSPPLLFIAFFTSHRSPLSERLEQANRFNKLCRTWLKRYWLLRKRQCMRDRKRIGGRQKSLSLPYHFSLALSGVPTSPPDKSEAYIYQGSLK